MLGFIHGFVTLAAESHGGAQVNTASLAAVPGKTNYLLGFDITGPGATAGSTIAITITGLNGGATPTYYYAVPTGPTVAAPTLSIRFNAAISASGQNVAISVSAPSFGSGNTAASVVVYGYRN
jgi:hypothetical protein